MKKLVLAAVLVAFASPAFAGPGGCGGDHKSASTPKPTTTAEKPQTPKPTKTTGGT